MAHLSAEFSCPGPNAIKVPAHSATAWIASWREIRREGRGVFLAAWHRWHPHQLRHNAATNLRREHGVELARIILGHAKVLATQIYAEADRLQAMSVIGKVG